MASELPNLKNVIYIPPTSPPPIDVFSNEDEYDATDADEAYDITGLSQKFVCEEDLKTSDCSNISDINLEHENENKDKPTSISPITIGKMDSSSSSDNLEILDCNYLTGSIDSDFNLSYPSEPNSVQICENSDRKPVVETKDISSFTPENQISENSFEKLSTPPIEESICSSQYQKEENSGLKLNTSDKNYEFNDCDTIHFVNNVILDSCELDNHKKLFCNERQFQSEDSMILQNDDHYENSDEDCEKHCNDNTEWNDDEDHEKFSYNITNDDEVMDDFGDFYSSSDIVKFSHFNVSQENYSDEFQFVDSNNSYSDTGKTEENLNFNYVEDTKITKPNEDSLQLEFSDEDEEEFNFEERFSKTETDSIRDNNLMDEKFRWLILKWISSTSSCTVTAGGNSNYSDYSNLTELIKDTFIWFHVANVEACLALQFSWTNSRMNKLYLASLNVDTRNILVGQRSKWVSSIPLFAQALSFSPLTPLRPSNNSVSWDLEHSKSTGSLVFDYLPQKKVPDQKFSADIQPNNVPPVPPVEFDWKSSGLTNPLSSSENEIWSSVKKDSSYSTREAETNIISSSLESEIKCADETWIDLEVFTSGVKEVLRNVPDLSFMRSKVLIFPIKEFSHV